MKTIGNRESGISSIDELLEGALFAAAAFLMTAGTLMTCLIRAAL